MDISLQVVRFLYHLRYKIILPSVLVACAVAYFTQFLPQQYTVLASVFTGIASNKGLDDDTQSDYMALANAFDNVISYTKSKGSLEKISMELLAQNLMYGSVLSNNEYISAKNYIYLLDVTPQEVLDLVDKSSLDTTLKNFNTYSQLGIDNFFYQIFNSDRPFYSYEALGAVKIYRVNTSDLIDLSYTSSDPGISKNTLVLITDKLIKSYEVFRYKSSDEVVAYYEQQLIIYKRKLNILENELQNFNVNNKIINYENQTKDLSFSLEQFENRYEQVLIEYTRSKDLIKALEAQLAVRGDLYSANSEFLKALDVISSISGEISETKMFKTNDDLSDPSEELEQQKRLQDAELNIKQISDKMIQTQYSKDGVVLEQIVNEWLTATISHVKSKADLSVLDKRRKYYDDKLIFYSPVGTQISRMEREINIIEKSYLNTLEYLGYARQRNNSIRLDSSSPEIVTPATFPINSNSRGRALLVLAAFMATLLLILSVEVALEVIDRTLRDPLRANRLTSLNVLGALLGPRQFNNRGYVRDNNRVSTKVICNKLNYLLHSSKTIYVNIISIENGEGKSFVTQFMKDEWEKQGLVVEVLNYGDDYLCDSNYLRAQSLEFFKHKPADVVFIKHPAYSQQSIPPVFLREAAVNIMVTNAGRGWRSCDDEYMKHIHKDMDNEILLILNNTNRRYVSYLIGDLSISNRDTQFENRIKHLALTSDANGVI